MDLDTSLESMLQHARVALGRRATPHGTPPRQQPGAGRTSRRHPLAAAPIMHSATDDAAVRELLETSDVDRWLATAHPDRKSTHDATRDRKAPLAPSRCMSPSRQVLVAAGHDKHVLPSFVSTHAVNAVGTVAPGSSHTRIASNAITAPAVVRQGTLDDVLSNVVVRHHLPMRIEPYARDHNSNHRSSIAGHGYSVGDRVSGFLNDQPNRASGVWGPNGELAIGFDDNDNPVVVVRSSSSGIREAADDALSSNNALSRKPAATAGATSKVSSVQSQALSSFEAPPPHLVLPMPEPPCLEVPLAGSINKSPTLSTGGGGKPLPTPTDGSSFKDVQFHFITPNLLSNTTSPPLACEPLAASTAGKPEDVAASDKLAKSSGRETAVTPVELVGTAPPSLIAPRLPPSPSHRQLDVQAAAGSKRTSVPQDTSTQTERVQPSPTDPQPAPPSVAPPPSVDETKPNISCPDHGQQLNVWEQLNPTAAGGQRALPVLRIPSEDDGIVFVGPYMRMDDRDPSFVSAMSQRDDRRSGVIPPLEFRRLIVGDGGGVASGTAAAAAPIIQDHAAAAAAVKGSRVVPAPTSRSQSLNTGGASAPPIEPSAAAGGPAATGKPPVTFPLRTYHAFHEEFPPPPPPPPKASTSRCWCC